MDAQEKAAQQAIDRWARSQPESIRTATLTTREILDEIKLAHHNLTVRASEFAFDQDQQYKVIYDACIVGSNALLHAHGYRASGAGGHRAAVTCAVGILRTLGHESAAKDAQSISSVLAVKRHEAAYERLHAIDTDDLHFAQSIAASVLPILCEAAAHRIDMDLSAEGISFHPESQ